MYFVDSKNFHLKGLNWVIASLRTCGHILADILSRSVKYQKIKLLKELNTYFSYFTRSLTKRVKGGRGGVEELDHLTNLSSSYR